MLIGVIANASNRETVGCQFGGPGKMMNGLFCGVSWGRQSSNPVRLTVRISINWSAHLPESMSIVIDPKRAFTVRVNGGGIPFWSSLHEGCLPGGPVGPGTGGAAGSPGRCQCRPRNSRRHRAILSDWDPMSGPYPDRAMTYRPLAPEMGPAHQRPLATATVE